jgi:triosephosphate isomerase
MTQSTIIINFKTYAESTGENAVKLAKICDDVAKETGADIRVAVQAVDVFRIAKEVSIPVYGQHCDDITAGAHTGFILPEALKEAGAKGSLVNHSEHKIPHDKVEAVVKRLKELGLATCICAVDDDEASKVDVFNPDFVAVEPPELIGGNISVSTARPELIKHSVDSVKNSKLLVGAGVKNANDVRIGLQLGAHGVLLASGITKAKDPRAVLLDLVSGTK